VHLCTAAVAHQGQLALASGDTSEEATERPLLTTEPASSPSHSVAPSPLLTPPDHHLSAVVVVSGSSSSSLTVVPPDSEPNVSKVGREDLAVGVAVSTPCHRMRAAESYDSSGASHTGLLVSSTHVENHPVSNGFLPPQPVYDRRRYRLPPPSIDMFAGAKLPGLDNPLHIWTRQIRITLAPRFSRRAWKTSMVQYRRLQSNAWRGHQPTSNWSRVRTRFTPC
jgi:hypothetical protein